VYRSEARISLASLLLFAPLTHVAQRAPASARIRDPFSMARCGSDIGKALIGRPFPNGSSKAVESVHTDIGLHDVGGSIVNDSLFLGGWSMCGREYHLLISDDKITAVLAFPKHSRRHPGIFGTCTVRGKPLKDGVLAVLDNPAPRAEGQPPYSPEDTTSLSAIAAWRIDEKNRQFRKLPATTVRCPRGQIFTIDGGM